MVTKVRGVPAGCMTRVLEPSSQDNKPVTKYIVTVLRIRIPFGRYKFIATLFLPFLRLSIRPPFFFSLLFLPLPYSLVGRQLSRSACGPSKDQAGRIQEKDMDPRAMQQNVLAACDEVRGAFAVISDRNHSVICPKPRRLAPLPPVVVPVRPVSRLPSYQSDLLDRCDTEAGSSLVGIFLSKGGREDQNQVVSWPSFFCGSPPSRVSNPVVLDARFGEDRPPVPIIHLPVVQSTSPAPAWKGCASAKFGYKPAALRVEGFDCLNRDGRSCSSITAVA